MISHRLFVVVAADFRAELRLTPQRVVILVRSRDTRYDPYFYGIDKACFKQTRQMPRPKSDDLRIVTGTEGARARPARPWQKSRVVRTKTEQSRIQNWHFPVFPGQLPES